LASSFPSLSRPPFIPALKSCSSFSSVRV
jgi:hypothetical protein